MSVASTFGRLFFGKLSDHPRVNRLYLYQMSFLCIGIADVLVPQVTNFTGLVMYMIAFGVFDGCFVTLLAIVVSDVVGIDKVSPGMGIKFFFMAITTFVGPPAAGKFKSEQSYIVLSKLTLRRKHAGKAKEKHDVL